MTVDVRIAVYGGAGTIGSRIVREALLREHIVTVLGRATDLHVAEGAVARVGDASDADDVARIAAEHDVVVSAISPSTAGPRPVNFLHAVAVLAENVGTRRLVVVGGSGSLQVSPGLRLMDTAAYPRDALPNAEVQAQALDLLRDTGALVDWVYISSAGSLSPGERTGSYQLGHDTPVGDGISAEDFAVAVLDEIEQPRYRRARINVAH